MMIRLDALLENVKDVCIAGHVRPDGDAVGSCLGLAAFIREYYPSVRCDVRLEPFSASFSFLEGADQVIPAAGEEKVYDLFFCLDCGDEGRLGQNAVYFQKAKKTVCIDHHISNQSFADENYIVPNASSTSELITELIGVDRISAKGAEALYMGIAHDTGVFQYSCTSSRTMELAGKLMDKGIDYSGIVADTFYARSYLRQQILGRALLESVRILDGKVIFSVMQKRELELYEAGPGDTDGIAEALRQTEGVHASIFIHETDTSQFRVSMRSDGKIDVAKVAVYFGGGGHVRAAGCTLNGNARDVINNIAEQMALQLGENAI